MAVTVSIALRPGLPTASTPFRTWSKPRTPIFTPLKEKGETKWWGKEKKCLKGLKFQKPGIME